MLHARRLRLTSRDLRHVNRADKVIAFHRWAGGGPRDDVVVFANFANRSYTDYRIGLPRGGRWRVRLNSDWRGYSAAFTGHASFDPDAHGADATDGMPCGGTIGIGPYTLPDPVAGCVTPGAVRHVQRE